MINELIRDLVYEKISLSQALTRSKLIARQIKNETFKNWLSKELNGYEYKDILLPKYRKIRAEVKLTVEFPFGQHQTFPVVLDKELGRFDEIINIHQVTDPIVILEQNIAQFKDRNGYISLSGKQLQIIGDFYRTYLEENNGVIQEGNKAIAKTQLLNIVELTKQKLIDTLQDLEEQFPDLDNKYPIGDENDKKVQNIITNNIYGNNNPLNVASGQTIKQGDINIEIQQLDLDKLRTLSLHESEIKELIKIDKDLPKGNSERSGKFLAWISKVTASLTARGVYESIPKVVEYVGNLI